MFSVYLYQLACCGENLRQIAGRLKNERIQVEDVLRELRSLSGMDEVIASLMGADARMQLQLQQMLSMTQALEQIRLRYEVAEQKICDNGEGNYHIAKRPGLQSFDLFDGEQIKKVNIEL